jgi:hypothetical protein
MKNRILLLSALTAIGFASCTNPNTSGTYTQEQLDSIVQYRVDSIAMELKMQNDSLIYAMADSIAMATKSAKPGSSTVTRPTKPVSHSTSPNNTTIKPAVRTQAQIDADKKAARFGDEAAKARLAQDEANKKAARFGDKDAQEAIEQTEADKKADRFKK